MTLPAAIVDKALAFVYGDEGAEGVETDEFMAMRLLLEHVAPDIMIYGEGGNLPRSRSAQSSGLNLVSENEQGGGK